MRQLSRFRVRLIVETAFLKGIRNPEANPHPRLQDFPRQKKARTNKGNQRVAWRQELGCGDKCLAAGIWYMHVSYGDVTIMTPTINSETTP